MSHSKDLISFTEHGSGPALLLVHGVMITGEMFEPVIGHFAARHRVIVPDLRGHGRSRRLPPPHTTAQLASDLAGLLDHLAIKSREAMAFDSRPRLSEIMCPTLIVAGSDDDAVPMHHAKVLLDGIVGSQLVVIQGADHALIWAHPEKLLRAVDEFLEARD